MDYEVQLEPAAERDQTQEALVVAFADGRVERMRLHEYSRVYAIPGLYEEVVQRRLECQSPRRLADLLVACAGRAGTLPPDLRVLDVGAGNGVVGEELRARGVEVLVATDNISEARAAAVRDRPGLYADYLVGDVDDLPELGPLIRERDLNSIVAAGALAFGHVSAASFARLWEHFPPGAWFAVSLHEELAAPGAGEFADYVDELERDGELVLRERFRHRLTMDGTPIHYLAIVARRPAALPAL
ncbi:MAG: methyltransferase [Actinomycetota bacterium]|nr:methyltransferase [Actinomycetota bacterium]